MRQPTETEREAGRLFDATRVIASTARANPNAADIAFDYLDEAEDEAITAYTRTRSPVDGTNVAMIQAIRRHLVACAGADAPAIYPEVDPEMEMHPQERLSPEAADEVRGVIVPLDQIAEQVEQRVERSEPPFGPRAPVRLRSEGPNR